MVKKEREKKKTLVKCYQLFSEKQTPENTKNIFLKIIFNKPNELLSTISTYVKCLSYVWLRRTKNEDFAQNS